MSKTRDNCRLLMEVVTCFDKEVFYQIRFGHDGTYTKDGVCTCSVKSGTSPVIVCLSYNALVYEIMRFQKHIYNAWNAQSDPKKMLRVFVMKSKGHGRNDYSFMEFADWPTALSRFKEQCEIRLQLKGLMRSGLDDKVRTENETLKAKMAVLETRLATAERDMKTLDLVNRSMAEQTKIANLMAHEGVRQAAVAMDALDACKCELEKEKELHEKCREDLSVTVLELTEVTRTATELRHELCESATVCLGDTNVFVV